MVVIPASVGRKGKDCSDVNGLRNDKKERKKKPVVTGKI